MPRSGGEASKLGNLYESDWTVDKIIDVSRGLFKSITVEPLGDDSRGVEFYLEKFESTLQFHSVKRQKQGGDWSLARLCKKDEATGRSILGDLFEKRQKYRDAETRFISAISATQLFNLSEQARFSADVANFLERLPKDLQQQFSKHIVPLCKDDEHSAFMALKTCEVILRAPEDLKRTVEQRINDHFYRMDRSDLRPDDVRRMIADLVHNNLGSKIDTNRLKSFFEEKGLGVWGPASTHLQAMVDKANQRYVSMTEGKLINSAQIPREVVVKIMAKLTDSESRGALVVAPGGHGKSCVLAQCRSQLSNKDTPYLCLRMDTIKPCNTARQLGKEIDLPFSPAEVLANLAGSTTSVLIVDQLDAMSSVSGRNLRMWEAFAELCEEVQKYPYMKMVLACRDFDLDHDHRLRSLNKRPGFTKFTLDKLTKHEVLSSLKTTKYGPLKLNERQFEILSVPLHLLLFLDGKLDPSFRSVGELYNAYWVYKRESLTARLGSDLHWNEVIDALTKRMNEDQKLFAPKLTTDNWPDTAEAMVSDHVLVEVPERNEYRFFHESFFDYAFARRFCRSKKNLVKFLESTDQHLFHRAQVRQILDFRREQDFDQYLFDIRELFKAPNVRFHIKSMVASGLRRIEDPRVEEWELVEPLLDGDLSKHVTKALCDHTGWFDLLHSQKIFEGWLASRDARHNNLVTCYLEAPQLHSKSTQIAELIAPYAQRDEWQPRLMRIMAFGKAYNSSKMTEIYLDLIARGAYDNFESGFQGSQFWSQHLRAEETAPKFVIDVLATWFDRAVEQFDDGEHQGFLKNCSLNKSRSGAAMVGKIAIKEPEYFVEKMLPRAKATVLKTEYCLGGQARNRAWPRLSNNADLLTINEAVLLGLRKALQHLAQHNVACFRRHAATISPYPHQTFGYLLLRAWSDNPEQCADEAAEYFIADQRRFDIGYSCCWSDGEGSGQSAISRTALNAISPHCSAELFEQMESRIIGYCNEKKATKSRGYAELLVLRSFDKSRISEQTSLRIKELERKFPRLKDTIAKEDTTDHIHASQPPIPEEKAKLMTDDQWISAMQTYNTLHSFNGGARELSCSLQTFVRRDRARFAALVARMPDNLNPVYFSAILTGLCIRGRKLSTEEKEKELKAMPTEVFLKVIEKLHKLPDRPCGSAISECIGMLSHRQLPTRALEIIAHYATSVPDPKSGQQTDGAPYQRDDINCVRGRAAEAISSLLSHDDTRLEALRPTLDTLSRDPVDDVRTCAINAFMPLLNFTRDLAVELFLKACDGSEAIWGTPPFNEFVQYAVYTHYKQLRGLLQLALKSGNTGAVESAACLTILAELEGIEVEEDATNIRSGSETMRKAAAKVYAQNISQNKVGNKCADRLEEFFNDESKAVLEEVSHSLNDLCGDRLLQLEGFITRFIESKSFEAGPVGLLHALDKSHTELPEVINRAAERILEKGGTEETQHFGITLLLPKLVVRQYEQTKKEEFKKDCLYLIDRMEQAGYNEIDRELSKIDREFT